MKHGLWVALVAATVLASEVPPGVQQKTPADDVGQEEKKAELMVSSGGVPALKMLDANKDGNLSPEEIGAYVNNVVQVRKEEAIQAYESLPLQRRVENPVTDFFKVPEIEQYEKVLEGLTERAAVFMKVYEQFRQLDRNHDDYISDEEFAYAERLVELLKPLAYPVDRNGNGMIGSFEVSLAAAKGVVLPSIKLYLARKWNIPQGYTRPKDALILRYDADNDGRLSIQEQNKLAWALVQASETFGAEAKNYGEILALLKARSDEALKELKERK
jgi:hypothetical protein